MSRAGGDADITCNWCGKKSPGRLFITPLALAALSDKRPCSAQPTTKE